MSGMVLGAIKWGVEVFRSPKARQTLAQKLAKPVLEGGQVVKGMEDVAGVITKKSLQTPVGKFINIHGFNDAGQLVESYGFIGKNG